ncbi:MAG: putative baseplate hub protein [Prokaryotic dsDNA virus sp.]|jgi:hypothetical protein|nr:MAG: putative baseplate hub protein [Prokaryotic dsDNA virus sp.]|tara:strand:+ start:3084 stop:5300 length:2217 start_codon:yes stop_codon:yes gene_type:complete
MGNPFKGIKKFFKGIKKAIKSITSFVGDIFSFVVSPFGALDTPDLNPEALASGVKVTKPGTNNGIPIVYGFRRVGSTPIFAETNGTDNKYLYVVYAICEGEIEGINRIKIDDNEIYPKVGANDVYTAGTVYNSSQGTYSGRLKFQLFYGTESQSQSSLMNETPTWKTANRKLPGIVYAAVRYEWKVSTQAEQESNPFGGGLPNLTFDVFGKKVYNVTTHTGGANVPDVYANLTKTWSDNPANCLLDYMMNTRYGAGFDRTEMDADSFKIAADKFNQSVSFNTEYSGKIMRFNSVVNPEAKIIDCVRQILTGARSILPYVQGRYKIKVEDGGNATDITSATISVAYDVTEDVLVGPITLGGEQKATKFNQVLVNYTDPDLEFSSQQVFFNEAGDKLLDDNEDLTGEFTFESIANPLIAKEMARMIYKKSRAQRTISFEATQELMNIEPGDIIRVTDEILDLNNQTFRVNNITMNVDMTVKIEAVEHDATVYPHIVGAQYELPPPLYLPKDYFGKPFQRPIYDPPRAFGQDPGDPGDPPPGDPTDPHTLSAWFPPISDGATWWFNQFPETYKTSPCIQNIRNSDQLGSGPSSASPVSYWNSLGWIGLGASCSRYELQFHRPLESGVTHMQFRIYKNAALILEKRIPWTFGITSGNTALPVLIQMPLNAGFEYSITYYKQDSDRTYSIGGNVDFNTRGFTSHRYRLRGQTKEDSSIEGYINFLKDTVTNVPNAGGGANLSG